VNLQLARRTAGVACVCAALLAGGCGKRGNPMPPLVRVPAPPTDLVVARFDDGVYMRVTVPASNVDGVKPADVARVDVYAITLDRDPRVLADLDPEELRELSTLVASEQVRRPLPPPLPSKEGAPAAEAPAEEPGADQGATIVLSETLTAAARTSVSVPSADENVRVMADERAVMLPIVAPTIESGPRRFYYAVAVSARGRHSPHTGLVPVPVDATSGAPSQPVIQVAETSATIRWSPPVDARGQTPPVEEGLLPSRLLVPAPPATTYEVYEVGRDAPEKTGVTFPAPLTASPVAATEWVQENVTLGARRCFVIRAVDTVHGAPVRGPASPVGCDPFADVFPPGPAHDVIAASVPGAINLIWEPSDAKDAAGYLVLRGEAGSDTLAPLNEAPITDLRYRDEAVKSGVRYVYAVVSVDRSGNKSKESNRVEETAR
jgi:hypothetical protein